MRLKKLFLIACLVVLIFLLSCSSSESTSSESSSFDRSNSFGKDFPSKTESTDESALTALENVEFSTYAGNSIFSIPLNEECSKIKATPLVIDNHIYFPIAGTNCVAEDGKEYDGIIVYDIENQELFEIPDLGNAEGTMTYVEQDNILFFPKARDSSQTTLRAIDLDSFSLLYSVSSISASIDTAALYFEDAVYFGTANPASGQCQTPINEDCGTFFELIDGSIENTLGLEQGYRAWTVGSPVTDGEFIYTATAKQAYGEVGVYDFEAEEYRYGCSILKLDADLNIVAYDDPDQPGCRGVTEHLLSVAVGELAVGPDGIWAQFSGPGEDGAGAALIHYDFDLQEICRAEFDTGDSFATGHYQAPTVDHEGNAYVVYTEPASRGVKEYVVYKVSPTCTSTELATTENKAEASLTLADDMYVLLASSGYLDIYSFDGDLIESYELSSDAGVIASPVVHDSVIYVFSIDGSVTMIEDSVVQDYGTAYWPRFRHDNHGTATLGYAYS